MGYAPYGWSNTDLFYLRQIEMLAEKGLLEIEGTNDNVMQNSVSRKN